MRLLDFLKLVWRALYVSERAMRARLVYLFLTYLLMDLLRVSFPE